MSVRISAEYASVRVPATSANLGPGFDSLGLAVRFYDEVDVRPVTYATHVDVEGVGAGKVPTDDNNLVVRALRFGLEAVGASQANFDMRCRNRVPHGSGMGSSASAAVAGLMLARCLIDEPEALNDEVILQLATEMEGHPDNVAPAIYGGATVSWMEAGKAHSAQIHLDASLPVTLLVPPESIRLSTAKAREVLPEIVSREDAIFNISRAALLMLGLTGQRQLLMSATQDRLHQDYRAEVLEDSTAVMRALREEGLPAVISGAGPTVLVLDKLPSHTRNTLRRHGWSVLSPGVDTQGAVQLPPLQLY